MASSIRNLKIRDQILLVTLPPLFVLLCAVALFFFAYWSAVNTERTAMGTQQSVSQEETLLQDLSELFMTVSEELASGRQAELAGQGEKLGKVLDILLLTARPNRCPVYKMPVLTSMAGKPTKVQQLTQARSPRRKAL